MKFKHYLAELAIFLEASWFVFFVAGIFLGWLLPIQTMFLVVLMVLPVASFVVAMVGFFHDHQHKLNVAGIVVGIVEFVMAAVIVLVGLAFSGIG